ncbi:putative pollen-specific leucine-rich repeat extensin-like protein 1 [Scophthalmus maximus]|uniref:Putative pollen-specific leucine-rich repeat extensin-like protein 1 n=1 Tax=Scophthalmus maximus TaxID=52904 RepID=A0A2U9CRS7_SCOMX|nr:putative pollen-specific leucine-rich repeat extensin-like protein 1 [Scophthalmus maximus]KAF0032481.1 hypothetical protein F2P81_014771 [Scophthalmus maximus]
MKSVITGSYDVPQPVYEDPDASTPPKPPRKSLMTKSVITSSYEVPQQDNEDPDAATPAVTDGSQCEVKVKPVPRPRSKILSKAQSNTSNTIAFVDKTGNTSNTVSAEHDEHSEERPRPVRPPPRPPIAKCLTSSKPTPDVDGDSLCGFAVSQYMSTNTEPTVTVYDIFETK